MPNPDKIAGLVESSLAVGLVAIGFSIWFSFKQNESPNDEDEYVMSDTTFFILLGIGLVCVAVIIWKEDVDFNEHE